jgi:hypothetical protein
MAVAITLVLSVLLAFVLWKTAKRLLRPNLPLPPGPKGWPIIGNLLQIPKDFEHETYHVWARECGMFIVLPVLFDTDSTLNGDFWHWQARTSFTSTFLGSHSCSLTSMRLR